MARAGALLAEIRPGDPPVLSWCDLETPAVIVGRAAGAPPISWEACAERGLSVHRRGSGGGVVLWDADLVAVDIVLPAQHPRLADDVVEAYRWVGEAAAEALTRLGLFTEVIDVQAARAAPKSPLADAACFGSLSPWEVTVDGRKVVGLSQVRRREGAVIQVGVPLRIDVGTLAAVIDGPNDALAAELTKQMVGVQDLQPISRQELVETLGEALEAGLGGRSAASTLAPREQAVEETLAQTHHAALTTPGEGVGRRRLPTSAKPERRDKGVGAG